jgi:hypothetical protein
MLCNSLAPASRYFFAYLSLNSHNFELVQVDMALIEIQVLCQGLALKRGIHVFFQHSFAYLPASRHLDN